MSTIQYPLGQTCVRPPTVFHIPGLGGVISAGGSWRFNPLDPGCFEYVFNLNVMPRDLPVAGPDHSDPSARFTIDRVYLPFLIVANLDGGIVGESWNVYSRGLVGGQIAYTWSTTIPINFNTLDAAGTVPNGMMWSILDVAPGYVVSASQRLAIEFLVVSSFYGNASVMLYTGTAPSINGWAGSGPNMSVVPASGFMQLTEVAAS